MNLYERMHSNRKYVRSQSGKLLTRHSMSELQARFLVSNQIHCENALYAWQVAKGYVQAPLNHEEELRKVTVEIQSMTEILRKALEIHK
jgi:hypothetical protein